MKATKLMALGLVGLTTLGLASTANAEDTQSSAETEASIKFGQYEYMPEVEGPGGGTYNPDDQNSGAVQNHGWQLIAPKTITFADNDKGGAVTEFGDGKFYALKELVEGTGVENPYVPLSLKLVYNSEMNHGTEAVTGGSITATRTALTTDTNSTVTGEIGIEDVAVATDTLITNTTIAEGNNLIPEGTENPLTINFTATQPTEPTEGTAQGFIFLAKDGTATKDQSLTKSGIYIKLNSALQDTTVKSTITWTLTTSVAGG